MKYLFEVDKINTTTKATACVVKDPGHVLHVNRHARIKIHTCRTAAGREETEWNTHNETNKHTNKKRSSKFQVFNDVES